MSHITVIINRAPPPPSSTAVTAETADPVTAYVTYVVPHEATDSEVGQMAKKLYRQVRDLGS